MNAIILAHGKAKEAVDRHTPGWREQFEELFFIAPADDPLPGAFSIGTSSYTGRGNIERMMVAVILASRFPRCAILEYDTVVFGTRWAKLPVERYPNFRGWGEIHPGFPGNGRLACGAVWPNVDSRFAAKQYGHSPWIATGETWWKIANAGANEQSGVPDRWLALACENAGIEICSLGGFSDECSRPWSRMILESAIQAARNGTTIFHGVKTREDYGTLTATAELWKEIP